MHLDQYIQDHDLASTVIINTLTRYNVPVFHPRVIGTYLRLTLKLIKNLPKVESVLITGSQGFISSIGCFFIFIAKFIYNNKVSVYVHGGGYDQYYLSRGRFFQGILKNLLNRADNFIVQSKQLGDALSSDFSNLSILPNWTKISEIRKLAVSKDSAPKPFSPDLIRFIYCGEIREEKGITELILAFRDIWKRIKESNRRVTLDLFGQINPAFQEEFESLLNDVDDANVQYGGYLNHSDLMAKLTEFDGLILPTYLPTEGYPGVIIEAMSVGLPIVTTRWRAIPEIVIDGRNGLLSEPKDHTSLLENIIKLALDDDLRFSMGNNALTEAEKFDTETVLPVLCDLIGL